jgi:hypothetical protein
LLLCPTAVVKIASVSIDNGTAGASFPEESSVIAIGAGMRIFSSAGNKSARNISSSVYGVGKGFDYIYMKKGELERKKKE